MSTVDAEDPRLRNGAYVSLDRRLIWIEGHDLSVIVDGEGEVFGVDCMTEKFTTISGDDLLRSRLEKSAPDAKTGATLL